MKNILEIYDIAVKEITERIPDASLKFICCDAEALSCSGYFYIFDGTKYIVHEHDMGRLTGVRELYSEEDCMWDMIKETILCSAYKKADREAWFRKFKDLYPERVDSEIKNLSYEFY